MFQALDVVLLRQQKDSGVLSHDLYAVEAGRVWSLGSVCVVADVQELEKTMKSFVIVIMHLDDTSLCFLLGISMYGKWHLASQFTLKGPQHIFSKNSQRAEMIQAWTFHSILLVRIVKSEPSPLVNKLHSLFSLDLLIELVSRYLSISVINSQVIWRPRLVSLRNGFVESID